jgi:beta-alanine degradation protein BauB
MGRLCTFAPRLGKLAAAARLTPPVIEEARRDERVKASGATAMMKAAGVAGMVALGTVAHAHDPVHTDGDKYKVKIEYARVRVLEYKDRPGEKTHQHSHPAFVLVALSPFKRKVTLPDGKAMIREFKAGDVFWSDEQTHIGENIGELPTHVLMIEMK